MSLADLLVLRPEFRARSLETATLDAAVNRVKDRYGQYGAGTLEDVETIFARINAANDSGNWTGVTIGDVATALHALLCRGLPIREALRDFLIEEARATTQPRLIDALARAYLETWELGSARTRFLRDLLIQKTAKMPVRWRTLFQACPEFLDAENGPRAVGERMVAVGSPYAWLREIGLAAPHGQGFMRLAHRAFLQSSPKPETLEVLNKLLTWAAPPGAPPLDDLRAAEVVDRILMPWVTRTCPAEYRDVCLKQLMAHFGDPRRDRPAFWGHVQEPHKRVLLKWLARESMEAMFEIVTAVSTADERNTRMWSVRKSFWMGLYEEGRIDEAWLAIGSSAVPVAQALYRRSGNDAYRTYGEFANRPSTCLLFMKIGTKTIVEGSHDFRVHVFPTPGRTTPQLYLSKYDLADILLPDPHSNACRHTGDWMDWVRRRIRK